MRAGKLGVIDAIESVDAACTSGGLTDCCAVTGSGDQAVEELFVFARNLLRSGGG